MRIGELHRKNGLNYIQGLRLRAQGLLPKVPLLVGGPNPRPAMLQFPEKGDLRLADALVRLEVRWKGSWFCVFTP